MDAQLGYSIFSREQNWVIPYFSGKKDTPQRSTSTSFSILQSPLGATPEIATLDNKSVTYVVGNHLLT